MAENLPSVSWPLKKWRKIYQVYPDPLRNGGKSTVYPDHLRNGEKFTKCILTPKEMAENLPIYPATSEMVKNHQVYPDPFRNGDKSTKCILTS